jgi:2-keto-4-pentenoate hydratase/2-oxohepta-3-ene-1,7-dioic acid hydratase in catechol pathway
MKFARYEVDGEVVYGIVEDGMVREITTSPFEEYESTDKVRPLSEVKLLAPCMPSSIFFMGGNYREPGQTPRATEPQVYVKTINSIIGPGDTIRLPRDAENVVEECEQVAVIGRRCHKVSKDEALDYVLGYTCGNDVSARTWQKNDPTVWRAKSSDTFAPIGPYIVTGLDEANMGVSARINGVEIQRCHTSDLVFDVATCISFISQTITLDPGDVLFTGTGGDNTELKHGDVVEIEVEGVGVLSNPVIRE